MSNEVLSDKPRRRYYSNELKDEVVRACGAPGASIAGIALSHGINANIVHRWLRERLGTGDQQEFLPVAIAPSVSSSRDDGSAVIEIELRRGGAVASIRWPLQDGGACAALLRDWLR